MPDNGEVVRGRYGSAAAFQVGDIGEDGEGSVDRRIVGGFREGSGSEAVVGILWLEWCRRRVGRGVVWNSSSFSVSGTGSMAKAPPERQDDHREVVCINNKGHGGTGRQVVVMVVMVVVVVAEEE